MDTHLLLSALSLPEAYDRCGEARRGAHLLRDLFTTPSWEGVAPREATGLPLQRFRFASGAACETLQHGYFYAYIIAN